MRKPKKSCLFSVFLSPLEKFSPSSFKGMAVRCIDGSHRINQIKSCVCYLYLKFVKFVVGA